MRNFVILFEEKEGTSPLVRLLDNFAQVSVVHQTDNKGWEPFDVHNCGRMPLDDLRSCLELVFSEGGDGRDELNRIYTRSGTRPLAGFDSSGSVGFKMRFVPPSRLGSLARRQRLPGVVARGLTSRFRTMMIDVLREKDVVVFFAVRQDVLRWGLSKYHGNGSGRPGHLQFGFARGDFTREDIGKIHVDCERLERIVSLCERSHERNRRLAGEFRGAGIDVRALRYEDFLADKPTYFRHLLEALGQQVDASDIADALSKGAYFKKVHSDDISEFVENHEEVTQRFRGRQVAWNETA